MCTAPSSSPSDLLILACTVLLGSFLVAPSASAQGQLMDPRNTGEKQLVDPLDGHQFSHRYVIGTNGLGGFDSDGCSYARGAQPRTFGVATSPTTLFSAPMDRWPDQLPDDLRDKLLPRLLDVGKDVSNVREMPPSDRYELAALSAEVMGGTDYAVGDLYLIGAWTIRDTIVGFFPGVQGSKDAWVKLAEVVEIAGRQTESIPRTRAMFDLARLAHRGGFIVERDSFLEQLDSFPDAGIGGKEKRTEFLARVKAEERLLLKARARYRKGLADKSGSPQEQSYYRYLTGELSRRLGDFDDARTDLEAAELAQGSTEEIKQSAKDVLEVIKVQARPEGGK